MNALELIRALRLIGKPVCTAAATRLAKDGPAEDGSRRSSPAQAGFDLHLRHAGLDKADAHILAEGMRYLSHGDGPCLRSFSASYNPELGDAGVTALVGAFPERMTELGLVGCSIGDTGGRAILEWALAAPDVQMICIEGNRFSAAMRSRFDDLASRGKPALVV